MSNAGRAATTCLLLLAATATGCDRERSPAPAERTSAISTSTSGKSAVSTPAPPAPEGTPKETAFGQARESDLPLLLVGTVVRDEPDKSMAAIRVAGALLARNFRPGQRVLDDAVLERVERQRVLLRRGGALEFLPLASAPDTATPVAQRAPLRTMPPPNSVIDLRRAEVDRALRDLSDLERQLAPGALDVEGKRLLIVTAVEPGNLFDLLGLREHDVLMQVDGEWIHDQLNPLWDALRDRERVRLLVMRGGFPQTLEFVIQ
jgi:type II secretory pathway component PulC